MRRIGEGGFAEVWLAMEEGEHAFRKKVALKILKEASSDEHAYESLLNEARLCGMLHHMHIVDVYGVSQAEGLTFVAMEYVEGITLDRLLARITAAGMTIPLSVILEVAIGISEALDHSHNAKDPEGNALHIVHRDLKPGNVMLAPGTGVKVADFGLAKATTSRNETMVGQVRGTPGYIAPEVWGGTRDFGPKVDLFALGVLLWEMATGQKLFEGSMIEVMGQCMHGEEQAEMDTLRRFRPELVPLVERLLKRDPVERTSTAWEVLVELREIREVVRAPGGLDLFLELLGVTGTTQRLTAAHRSVRGSSDDSWNRLMVMAGYSVPDMPAVGAPTDTLEPAPITDAMIPAIEMQAGARIPSWAWVLLGVGFVGLIVGAGLLVRAGADRAGGTEGIEPAVAEPEGAPSESAPPEQVEAVPEQEAVEQEVAQVEAAEAGEVDATEAEQDAVDAAPEPVEPPPAKEPTPAPPVVKEPEPVAAVTPVQPEVVAPEPVPEPSPAPVVAAEPAAAPAKGCVVFQSFPPGADVLVGGRGTGLVALGGDSTRREYDVGTLSVSMASEGATLATASVPVEAGGRVIVRCDLLKGGECTVRRAAGTCD